jgi:hypothetical protein
MEKKYNHAEAFCLLKYRCATCGKEEYLWNSRDGVTPFSLRCGCDIMNFMNHVDFNKDIPIPGLHPIGIRWFVDLTKEKAREYKAKQFAIEKENNRLPEWGKTEKEFCDALLEDDFIDGSPDILSLEEVRFEVEKLLKV